MKRRHAILLLGGASSGAMSVGTGAFSSVEADRGVEVNIVDDENAYLGLEDETDDEVVRVRNQFGGNLSLTVTASLPSRGGKVEIEAEDDDDKVEIEIESDEDGGEDDDGRSAHVEIPIGESADVIAECDGNGPLDLRLTFSGEVADTGTTVNKTQTFTVECEEDGDSDETNEDVTDEVTKVKFFGSREKIRILTTENEGGGNGIEGTVSAKLYYGDEEETANESFKKVSVNTDLRVEDFGDGDLEEPITGVKIDGIGVFEDPDT